MRMGILGGTFDPIHEGHMAMAECAMRHARLDRVLMIPCNRPPHKDRPDLTGAFHRFAMLALSIQDRDGFVASDLELQRGEISYTVDTLGEIAADRPDDDLFLILGSDSFVELDTWRAPEEILSAVGLLVVPRPGIEAGEIASRAPAALRKILLPDSSHASGADRESLPFAVVVESNPVDLSSTTIRTRARDGRPISGMVPAPVETYIRKQGLYGATVHP